MHSTVPAIAHPAPSVGVARRRVPLPRAALMALTAAAAAVAAAWLSSPWILLAWLVPDVALIAGMSSEFAGQGRLAPRAVRAYNALHALPGPVGVIAAGVVVPALLGPGLLWLSHVLADRALGYGLRARDGWQRV